MGKLLLVDGSALLHRAYHAYPPLTTKSGQVVGAVYGVVSMLISALEEIAPEQVVVAWDLPKPTFRHEKYVAYKAQRAKADEEMVEQIPTVKEVIRAMGLVQLAEEGYEADDIIGSLAVQATNEKHQILNPKSQTSAKSQIKKNSKQKTEVIILSGDMDLTQLVTEKVKMLSPARGRQPAKLYGPEEVREKLGIEPKQVVDYKALVGDSSDNIPGVRGIGPKTAQSLLEEYETLEKIYENLDSISERVREKLAKGKEGAFLSQELARIVTEMKLEVDNKAIVYEGLEREELKKMLEELNFKSLARRVFKEELLASSGRIRVDERQLGMF